jgi:Tol biopolymer transport system component
MANDRSTLERVANRVPVPQPAFDRLVRRRDRRARGRRIRSSALAVCLSFVSILLVVRNFGAPNDDVPAAGGPGTIAFTDGGSGSQLSIVSMAGDGTAMATIRSGLNPAYSPDGTRIAFLEPEADDRFAIAVMNADGTGASTIRPVAPIASPVLFESQGGPSWSPDGQKLAFVSPPAGAPLGNVANVYTMNADGSGERQLTSDGDSWSPAWSADGRKIVFVSGDRIWVMNSDGSGATMLTPTLRYPESPTFAPDGSRIVVANDTDLYFVSRDGTSVTRVVHTNGIVRSPVWSPDGSRIAFIECDLHWSSCGIHELDVATGQVDVLNPSLDPRGASRSRLSWASAG